MIWLPNQVTGINFWYAADAIQLADNTAVATWPDSGPNGYTLTAVTAPTFKLTGGPNSMPAVLFNGTTTKMTSTADCAYLSGPGMTAFSVVSTTQITANASAFSISTAGSAKLGWRMNTTGHMSLQDVNVGPIGSATSALVINTWTMNSGDFQNIGAGATWHMFKAGAADGNSTFATALTAAGNNVFQIGASGTIEFWTGSIAEVITYERVLTAQERALVHTYLSTKYKIPVSDWTTYPPLPGSTGGPVAGGTQ